MDLLIRSDALTTGFNPEHVFAPFLPGALAGTYREDVTRRLFERRYPGVVVKSIVPAMVSLRKVLDADEIAAMRRVATISRGGAATRYCARRARHRRAGDCRGD